MTADKPFWQSATKITLIALTLGVIVAPFMSIALPAEYYAGWMLVLGFYFGQKLNVQNATESTKS